MNCRNARSNNAIADKQVSCTRNWLQCPMAGFKWSSAHLVYWPDIDSEHRALFRLGERLQKGMSNGTDLATLRPALLNLIATAEAHFVHEERTMKAAQYPAFGWHKKQHDAVRSRMRPLLK